MRPRLVNEIFQADSGLQWNKMNKWWLGERSVWGLLGNRLDLWDTDFKVQRAKVLGAMDQGNNLFTSGLFPGRGDFYD